MEQTAEKIKEKKTTKEILDDHPEAKKEQIAKVRNDLMGTPKAIRENASRMIIASLLMSAIETDDYEKHKIYFALEAAAEAHLEASKSILESLGKMKSRTKEKE